MSPDSKFCQPLGITDRFVPLTIDQHNFILDMTIGTSPIVDFGEGQGVLCTN